MSSTINKEDWNWLLQDDPQHQARMWQQTRAEKSMCQASTQCNIKLRPAARPAEPGMVLVPVPGVWSDSKKKLEEESSAFTEYQRQQNRLQTADCGGT